MGHGITHALLEVCHDQNAVPLVTGEGVRPGLRARVALRVAIYKFSSDYYFLIDFTCDSSAVGPGGVRGLKPFKLETGENQLLVV